MRKPLVFLLVGVFLLGTATSGLADPDDHRRSYRHHYRYDVDWDDDISFDLDDGTLIIIHERDRRDRSVVEFTEKHELFIDGDKIALDEDQSVLVAAFYDQSMEIVDHAKEIGWEGAKVGVEGAKLGLKAIGCLFKLISPNYDSDDMEDEMERAAERIEWKAERLEAKAELIEDMVEELDDLADEMCREIPELDDLGWF